MMAPNNNCLSAITYRWWTYNSSLGTRRWRKCSIINSGNTRTACDDWRSAYDRIADNSTLSSSCSHTCSICSYNCSVCSYNCRVPVYCYIYSACTQTRKARRSYRSLNSLCTVDAICTSSTSSTRSARGACCTC